ncbi:hypothetical protein [Nonomuraea sp. NPDC003201]
MPSAPISSASRRARSVASAPLSVMTPRDHRGGSLFLSRDPGVAVEVPAQFDQLIEAGTPVRHGVTLA